MITKSQRHDFMPSLWLQYTYYWTYFTEAGDNMSTVGLGESRRVEGSENTLQNKCTLNKILLVLRTLLLVFAVLLCPGLI